MHTPKMPGDQCQSGGILGRLFLCPQLGLEVSPSTLFAVASILEGCAFLNGSPQNTLVPGALELASQRHVFVGGDDFKSGQTKVKSVLVDFLIGSGLKVHFRLHSVPGGKEARVRVSQSVHHLSDYTDHVHREL